MRFAPKIDYELQLSDPLFLKMLNCSFKPSFPSINNEFNLTTKSVIQLKPAAIKQTLSISKVENELRMKTPSQFEKSYIFEEVTDPNFPSIQTRNLF